jgi:hypothetical protein
MNRQRSVLGALGFALFSATPVWAQGAGRPEEPSGTGLVLMVLLLLPVLLIIVFLVPTIRRSKRLYSQYQ